MSFNVNNIAVNAAYFNGSAVSSIYFNNVLVWEDCPYTELVYIESTGTQYIDTGFKPNQDTRVVLDFQMASENTSLAANDLFGARTSASSKAYAVQWNTSNDQFQHFYNNGYNNLTFGDFNKRQIVELNKNVMYLDGTSNTRTYASFQCDYSMYLCAINNAGTAAFFSNMRIYACQIYDNGTLVRDFIPVKMNDTGAIGLWDKVNRQFYSNPGTGGFIGKEFDNFYVEIDYIQASGTQYVDTGFQPNNNTRVVMDAQFTATPTAASTLCGARVSATDRNYALLYTSSGALRSDYNNVYTQEWSVGATTRRIYDKNKETTTVNGTSQSYTNATFQVPHNLYLCASNNAGTASYLSKMKVYSCQIYDNDVLIRDFIPVQKIEDADIGLYDKVNKKFYGSAGSGKFTCDTAPLEPTYTWGGWDNATWADISALCKAKQAGTIDAWPDDVVVGASKTVTLSTAVLGTSSVAAYIIGMDIDGDGVLTFQTGDFSTTTKWATSTSTKWTASTVKSLCTNIYNYCDAKSYIKTLRKGTCLSDSSTVTYADETVWLASYSELYSNISRKEFTSGVTTCYTKRQGTKGNVWTRSIWPGTGSSTERVVVRKDNGTATGVSPTTALYILPCFAIG